MRESIQKVKAEMIEKGQKAVLVDQLVDGHDFDVPESLLESELLMLVEEEKKRRPDADADQLQEELKKRAVRNVKANILLDLIAEKENVDVTEGELKARIAELASSMYLSPENFVEMYLKSDAAMGLFRQNLVRDKALDVVLQKAVKEPFETEEADGAAAVEG